MTEDLISIDEAATILGISNARVYQFINDGTLDCVTMWGTKLLVRAQVHRLAEERLEKTAKG